MPCLTREWLFQLLSYTLRVSPGDRAAVGDHGLVLTLVTLLDSSDSDIREAALAVATMFAEAPEQLRFLHQVRSAPTNAPIIKYFCSN